MKYEFKRKGFDIQLQTVQLLSVYFLFVGISYMTITLVSYMLFFQGIFPSHHAGLLTVKQKVSVASVLFPAQVLNLEYNHNKNIFNPCAHYNDSKLCVLSVGQSVLLFVCDTWITVGRPVRSCPHRHMQNKFTAWQLVAPLLLLLLKMYQASTVGAAHLCLPD